VSSVLSVVATSNGPTPCAGVADFPVAVQTAEEMTVRILCLATALATALQVVPTPGPQKLPASADSPLRLSHRARAVAPGEVVLVDVRAQAAFEDVHGRWMGQAVGFYKVEPGWWQGLAAIDVGAAAGRQTLTVRARTTDGRTLEGSYPMTIAARTFPARRITVAPKFVDPPADELPRIEAERKTVEALFTNPTRERLWSEPFIVPVPGAATSSFGRRTILNGIPRGQHTGTDFQAAAGTPVVAPNRGRVALAADHYFPGRTIIIDHGLGVYSYLAHLSEFTVADGAIVGRGERIALSGATGRVTGPHLHWTMRFGSARVDPLSLVEVSK
jgi:murein DD-endopeptidase MepM/ murein hydrolase activator NlpD